MRRACDGSGFEPVPHLAVRAFADVTEIDRFLARLAAEAGVRQVLVIAGDRDPPAGSLRGALDVIDSGLLQRHGIREVGIAGYPEGHPRIPGHELDRALADKIAAAETTGLALHIVTQFCFDADAIIGWIRRLRDFGHDTPVRIGLAGPTSLPTLMRYAGRCGVAASLQGLARHAGHDAPPVRDVGARRHRARAGGGARTARRRAAAFLLVRRTAADRALGVGGGTRPDRARGRAGIQGRTGRLNALAVVRRSA